MIKEHLENLKNNKWLVDITAYKGGSSNIPVIRYIVHKNTIELVSFVNKREIVYLYPAKSSIMELKPITNEMIEDTEKIINNK